MWKRIGNEIPYKLRQERHVCKKKQFPKHKSSVRSGMFVKKSSFQNIKAPSEAACYTDSPLVLYDAECKSGGVQKLSGAVFCTR